MPQDNAEQLAKLAQIFNADKIVSKEELDGVLKALITVLSNNKKSTEALNEETKQQVIDLFEKVVESQYKLQQQIEEKVSSHKTELTTDMEDRMSKTTADCKALMDECRMLMPQDGKDANPEDVVPLVLEKIKLPEYKETVLDDGEAIVNKINELEIEPEKQIDAKHIKNLPKQSGSGGFGGVSRNITWFDESTLIIDNPTKVKFAGSGVSAAMSGDTLVVTVSGGGGGSSIETPTGTIDGSNTTFTVLNTPLYIVSDGATYFENSGYTLAGLTLTLAVPPVGFTRSFY